jgi:hypothetical protein
MAASTLLSGVPSGSALRELNGMRRKELVKDAFRGRGNASGHPRTAWRKGH